MKAAALLDSLYPRCQMTRPLTMVGIDSLGEAFSLLFIGQEIGGQRQMTLHEDAHQAVSAQGADQIVEGHR